MTSALNIDVDHARVLAQDLARTALPQSAGYSPPPIPGAHDFLSALVTAYQATAAQAELFGRYARWAGEESLRAVSLIDATNAHTATTLDAHGERL